MCGGASCGFWKVKCMQWAHYHALYYGESFLLWILDVFGTHDNWHKMGKSIVWTVTIMYVTKTNIVIFRTDPHLIAWFSSREFVPLGFPISTQGVFMHLSN